MRIECAIFISGDGEGVLVKQVCTHCLSSFILNTVVVAQSSVDDHMVPFLCQVFWLPL